MIFTKQRKILTRGEMNNESQYIRSNLIGWRGCHLAVDLDIWKKKKYEDPVGCRFSKSVCPWRIGECDFGKDKNSLILLT